MGVEQPWAAGANEKQEFELRHELAGADQEVERLLGDLDDYFMVSPISPEYKPEVLELLGSLEVARANAQAAFNRWLERAKESLQPDA